jgi:hypothetical protein
LHNLDEGTYASGHEIADLYERTHEHALVVLDYAWEGRPPKVDPDGMVKSVEDKLRRRWGDRAGCIVIVPELEIWLWSDSPLVAKSLGWASMAELRRWLQTENLWAVGQHKPAHPKEAYLRAIRAKRVQKSNAIFRELAETVSLKKCSDGSFLRLLGILRGWFPPVAGAERQTS